MPAPPPPHRPLRLDPESPSANPGPATPVSRRCRRHRAWKSSRLSSAPQLASCRPPPVHRSPMDGISRSQGVAYRRRTTPAFPAGGAADAPQATMATRYFGERIRRNEDPRLLTGGGTFVDDITLPDLLHAALLRSPHAHARVHRVDTAGAEALPGVVAVYTHADLPASLQEPLPRLIPHPALVHHKTQYALAHDKVRHVGEPVAFVVATNRYVAEDALDLIEVEYDPLQPVVTLEQAAQPEAPLLHEDAGTNICAHYTQHVGNVDEAFAHAAHVFTERFVIDRGTAAPMECRGVVAEWDPRLRQLMVWDSTQAPIPIRNGLARLLNLAQANVRVIAPDVGGGVGPQIMR